MFYCSQHAFSHAFSLCMILLLLTTGCDRAQDAAADTIYINGHILTMSHPVHARALSIKDGKVQAVGTRAGVMRHHGDNTRIVDLQGKTLMPGWYAVHSPFMAVVEAVGIKDAQYRFAQAGYTTVVEKHASIAALQQLQAANKQQVLSLDILALVPYATFQSTLSQHTLPLPFRQTGDLTPSSLKLAGVTLALDGNMHTQTAWLAIPYATQPPDRPPHWQGQPAMPYSQFRHAYQLALDHKVQLFIHAMGDAAIDALIQASDDLAITVEQQQRTVVMTSRYMRVNQLDQYKRLGLQACFDSRHLVKHGDSDITWLGQDRAAAQSPLHTAMLRHLAVTNQCERFIRQGTADTDTSSTDNASHTDDSAATDVPDGMLSVWSAVNRMTEQGTIMGDAERISALHALKTLTRHAAYHFFEEKYKGRLVPGMQADMVILSANPLDVPTGELRTIQVIETIKAGRTLYPSPSGTAPADIKHVPSSPYQYSP
ncbi:amidohydrolase family protein [Photobacterium japonica]|uniref:amidohydrolase family protein n=1 Tax=Photobacterium japonica TaxID=2910235 RepID=UPI003D0D978B